MKDLHQPSSSGPTRTQLLFAMTLFVFAATVLPAALSMQDPQKPTQDPQGRGQAATTAATDQDPAAENPVAARLRGLNELVEQFARINETLANESRDWRRGEEIYSDQITLIEAEIADLEEGTEDARKNLAETEEDFARLTDEKAELVTATQGLEEIIGELEAQVRELTDGFPEPLKARLERSLALIPESEEQAKERKLDIARRFPPILAILAQAEKFQNGVHLEVQTVPVSNGERAECSVIYFGLGQAFYVSRDRTFAGTGHPTAEGGWTWLAQNTVAQQVGQVVDILNAEGPAVYVELPVQLQVGER
ncbi:MAG: DUF3450 family protein [Planctomycetota bacterium]